MNSKVEYNQYTVRDSEAERIKESRLQISQHKQTWDYDHEAREISSKNKCKYQDVSMSNKMEFLDDMKNLIYDPKTFPDDLQLFEKGSQWRLIGFEPQNFESEIVKVPSLAFLRKKGEQGDIQAFDKQYGQVQLQGRIGAKFNEPSYSQLHYNLRRQMIFFYEITPDAQNKELFSILFTQTSFNTQSQTDEYFSLKHGDRLLKLKKQNQSRDVIRALQKKLLWSAMKGSFCLRNEVPHVQICDYLNREVDLVHGVDFVHQTHIKDITSSRYYRESIGGFIHLLNKEAFKRKNISGSITYPKWLRQNYKKMGNYETSLITNMVPNKNPLKSLKIKLNEQDIPRFGENLKYIFPFFKQFVKRTLVIYESNLQDENLKYLMTQLSYPMHTLAFPKNQLSIQGLQYAINASSTLYHETLDFSFNTKLVNISGSKIFSLANNNPSIKKLVIKGCYVLLGEEQEFFVGLSNNMCLKYIEIDYMDNYNDFMIRYLENYDAEIY